MFLFVLLGLQSLRWSEWTVMHKTHSFISVSKANQFLRPISIAITCYVLFEYIYVNMCYVFILKASLNVLMDCCNLCHPFLFPSSHPDCFFLSTPGLNCINYQIRFIIIRFVLSLPLFKHSKFIITYPIASEIWQNISSVIFMRKK